MEILHPASGGVLQTEPAQHKALPAGDLFRRKMSTLPLLKDTGGLVVTAVNIGKVGKPDIRRAAAVLLEMIHAGAQRFSQSIQTVDLGAGRRAQPVQPIPKIKGAGCLES